MSNKLEMKNPYEIAWNLLEKSYVTKFLNIEEITGLNRNQIENLKLKFKIAEVLKGFIGSSLESINTAKEVIEAIENKTPIYLPTHLSDVSDDN